jgi:hypothetical protein
MQSETERGEKYRLNDESSGTGSRGTRSGDGEVPGRRARSNVLDGYTKTSSDHGGTDDRGSCLGWSDVDTCRGELSLRTCTRNPPCTDVSTPVALAGDIDDARVLYRTSAPSHLSVKVLILFERVQAGATGTA